MSTLRRCRDVVNPHILGAFHIPGGERREERAEASMRERDRSIPLSSSQEALRACSARLSAHSSRATEWYCARAASVTTVASGSSTVYLSVNTSQPGGQEASIH